MQLIKLLKKKVMSSKSKYRLYTVACSHEVVRLPVAHWELNPIEMAWSQVNDYVKANNEKYFSNRK